MLTAGDEALAIAASEVQNLQPPLLSREEVSGAANTSAPDRPVCRRHTSSFFPKHHRPRRQSGDSSLTIVVPSTAEGNHEHVKEEGEGGKNDENTESPPDGFDRNRLGGERAKQQGHSRPLMATW